MLPEVAQFGEKHGLSPAAQKELQGLMSASITLTQKKVTVTVPGSVANLGPGLESCGLAVDVWDEISLEYAEEFSLEMSGESAGQVPRAKDQNLAVAGAASAFEAAGRPFPALRVKCEHRIPWGKSLGAECASFVGGFLAGSVLCSEELNTLASDGELHDRIPRKNSSLLDALGQTAMARTPTAADGMSASLEAPAAPQKEGGSNVDALLHATIARGWNPGNVCPAIYGALQVGVDTPTGFRSHRVPVPNGLVCVLFVPDAQPDGAALPKQPVDRKAAIFNVGRTALLINCFCSNDFEMFAKACQDTLSQPHCAKQFPYMADVIQAALDAGATGALPCGYGPSVFALITGRTGDVLAQSSSNELERAVAKAMISKAAEAGCAGRVLIAKPADVGAHVVAQKSELGVSEANERIIYFQ